MSGAASVAVVGGGLAGLAAAAALAGRGLRVEVFEMRRRLGGRAGSFQDPQTGQWIDHCQHVAMGCCTNLADFARRTGIADCFARHGRLHFFGPDGRRRDFAAWPWLPAPLHLLPGLMRLDYLGLGERLGILRAMGRLAKLRGEGAADEKGTCTIGAWLRAQGQSQRAIELFWSPVLVSALSETPDRASLAAARKVFVDGFLAARDAHQVEIPRVALAEIYDRRLAAWLGSAGVTVHLGARVRQIEGDGRCAREVVLADGSRREFDWFVAAVPWRQAPGLFSPPLVESLPRLRDAEQIEPAAITAVHLWFDRPITPLAHAVLVGRLSQWLFGRGPQPLDDASRGRGHYYQVVISASHAVGDRRHADIASRVVEELRAVFPAARDAGLLHQRVVTQPEAVFSVRPGLDAIRPPQETPVRNLALAGDWTATGWPATMEGAVRSGYLAAEAILRAAGRPERVLVPDLPGARLARWLTKS